MLTVSLSALAQSLYRSSSELIDQLCTNSHDLKELTLLTSKDSLASSSLAEKIRYAERERERERERDLLMPTNNT